MSRGAVKNPDRKRELKRVEIPPHVQAMLEPGAKAYRMGPCTVICSRQRVGWHLSISRTDRLPSWEECRDARYELVPNEVTMALILPPREEYVNAHEFCLQLYEVDPDYLEMKDRL